MGVGALPCATSPYHSHDSGSPGQCCVARRATVCLTGFPFPREWDGGTPVRHTTLPLPRKWESRTILCRPKGDPLVYLDSRFHGNGGWGHSRAPHHLTTPTKVGVQDNAVSPEGQPLSLPGFPFPREWGWGHSRAPHHLTTPTKVGVQDNAVSPEGRLFVSLDSRFHGNGGGGTPVRHTTLPLPRKWESSPMLCRPQGDSLSHWIPVSTGMGWGTPANSATLPLPCKRESSRTLCRPQGDPFYL